MTTQEKKYLEELVKAFTVASKDKRLLAEFLIDILTPNELEEVAKRLQIVKKLRAGESHRQIAEELEVGVATVNRGSRELLNPQGGFHKVLDKLN